MTVMFTLPNTYAEWGKGRAAYEASLSAKPEWTKPVIDFVSAYDLPFKWTWRDSFWHQVWDYLAAFPSIRDRFRCPECKIVGCFKPYGGRINNARTNSVFPVRRWLCKCCGYCLSQQIGKTWVAPHSKLGVWAEKCEESGPTPWEILRERSWPWLG